MNRYWQRFDFGDAAEEHVQIRGRPDIREPFGEWLVEHVDVLAHRYFSFDPPVTNNQIETFFGEHPELLLVANSTSNTTLSTVVVAITSDTPLPTVIQWLTSYARIADLTSELARDTAITSPFVAAHGGVADVYRVTRSDRKQLAIKCLRRHDPKHVKRTARELRIWSNLKHKNVLELYGLGVFQGYLAIVSPWMVYGSVVSVVKKWPDMNRYILCRQLIAAIEYLHHVDVIHGDIKGENVLVAEDGILKLADFGLSVMHDNTFQFSQTDPGGGTSRWMAPELWTEYGQRSSEADVYAMGMTMFEIITGKPPFYEIESTHQIVIKVLQERCTPQVPELQSETAPPEARLMYNILQWCWKYEPRERPTAQEVVALTNELTD